jgi:hypothetical protein
LQALGAGAAFVRHQGAERVFVALIMVRQLPGLDGLQGDGQTGEVAEGTFVILVNLGVYERIHQRAVGVTVFGVIRRQALRLKAGSFRGDLVCCTGKYCLHADNLRLLHGNLQLVRPLIEEGEKGLAG